MVKKSSAFCRASSRFPSILIRQLEIVANQVSALVLYIPAQREHPIWNVNTESGEMPKVFTLRPDWVFTLGRNMHVGSWALTMKITGFSQPDGLNWSGGRCWVRSSGPCCVKVLDGYIN